jgi:hypothetical protein
MISKSDLPDILKAQDVADFLGISRRRVYELLQMSEKVGGIKCISIGASKRVEKNDFLQWLENQKS